MREQQKRHERPFLRFVARDDIAQAKADLEDPNKIAPMETTEFAKRLSEVVVQALNGTRACRNKRRCG